MKNMLFVVTIIVLATVALAVAGIIAFKSSDRSDARPKVDFSDIINKKWSTYQGGGSEEINGIEDDLDLQSAVFLWCLPDESNYSKALEEVLEYNSGKRAVYLVNTLDGEVCNGGFNQYFYNKGPVLAEETIKSLQHIGQTDRALILQKALENYSFVKESHAAASSAGSPKEQLEAFSATYNDNPLDALDSAYYEAGADMWKILARYIRENPDEFKK